jgi:phage-related minor tail protein
MRTQLDQLTLKSQTFNQAVKTFETSANQVGSSMGALSNNFKTTSATGKTLTDSLKTKGTGIKGLETETKSLTDKLKSGFLKSSRFITGLAGAGAANSTALFSLVKFFII